MIIQTLFTLPWMTASLVQGNAQKKLLLGEKKKRRRALNKINFLISDQTIKMNPFIILTENTHTQLQRNGKKMLIMKSKWKKKIQMVMLLHEIYGCFHNSDVNEHLIAPSIVKCLSYFFLQTFIGCSLGCRQFWVAALKMQQQQQPGAAPNRHPWGFAKYYLHLLSITALCSERDRVKTIYGQIHHRFKSRQLLPCSRFCHWMQIVMSLAFLDGSIVIRQKDHSVRVSAKSSSSQVVSHWLCLSGAAGAAGRVTRGQQGNFCVLHV